MKTMATYVLGLVWVASSLAAKPSVIGLAKSLWNPETMMQRACESISRHYDLDPAQKDFTCKLLTERTTRFLDKHENKIWPLLGELMRHQPQPGADVAKRIASEGYGVFEEARAEIMKAQDDFRKILNDRQKKIHDGDLKGLDRTFNLIDKGLQDWKQGKGGLSPLKRFRLPGSRQSLTEPIPSITDRAFRRETEWERYVRDFIRKYNLDASQKISAQAILKDLQEQANQYRQTHTKDLVDADRFLREAQRTRPLVPQEVEQGIMIRNMLHKPFIDWFEQLKGRLDQIPTENQKAEYNQRAKELEAKVLLRRDPPAEPS